MANINGTNVPAEIVPYTDADAYATHRAFYGQGGLRTVATIAERNAITLQRQDVGMLVYVTATGRLYRLKATGAPPLLDTAWDTMGDDGTGTWGGNTIAADKGGTGLSSFAQGSMLYASAANAWSALSPGATGQVLKSNGTAAPSWSDITKSDIGLANVENTALSTWGGSGSITTLGNITSGTWNGSVIGINKGGTGATDAASARANLGAAPIDSPVFTGTPEVPTAAPGKFDNQIASTAFVTTAVQNATGTAGSTTAHNTWTGLNSWTNRSIFSNELLLSGDAWLATNGVSGSVPVFLRGVSAKPNLSDYARISVGGYKYTAGGGTGLIFAVFSIGAGNKLQAVTPATIYDTQNFANASNNLASAINSLKVNCIGVIVSYGPWEGQVTSALRAALKRVGLHKAANIGSDTGKPYAAIFGLGSGYSFDVTNGQSVIANEVIASNSWANPLIVDISGFVSWVGQGLPDNGTIALSFSTTGAPYSHLSTIDGTGAAYYVNAAGDLVNAAGATMLSASGSWGGSVIGIDKGGTGATDAATARANLGLSIGSNVQAYSATLAAIAAGTWAGAGSITTLGNITSGTWNGSVIGINKGGTGATDAATARANFGLAIGSDVQAYNGTLAAIAAGTWGGSGSITTLGNITSGTWNGSVIGVNKGGTGAADAATARANLGLSIGSNVQAYSATLAAIAAGTWAGAGSITTLGNITSGTWNGSVIGINKGGTGATDAATARANLGLGSAAVENASYTGVGDTLVKRGPYGDVEVTKLNATFQSSFGVYRSASLSTGGSYATNKVIFDVKEWDTQGEYSTSNGNFTAQQAGIYFFCGHITLPNLASTTNRWQLMLLKNNVEAAYGTFAGNADGAPDGMGTQVTALLKLNVGDVVNLAYSFGGPSGINMRVGRSQAYFCGYRLP